MPIIASDHTRLQKRDNRIWSMGNDIPVPGLRTAAMVVALVAGLVVAGLTTVIVILTPGPPVAGLLPVVTGAAAAVLGYVAAQKPRSGETPLASWIWIMVDYIFRQPRHISGSLRDDEPDQLHWQVIVWEPRSWEWLTTFRTLVQARTGLPEERTQR